MYGIHKSVGLAGKSIVVTGGASGMGRATALLLADAGAKVTIGDINEAGMAETVALARDLAGEIAMVRADVSVEGDIAALVARAVANFGRLDGAANIAGFPPSQKLLTDITWEEWQRCATINLGGVFFCMKHQIQAMLAQDGKGAIVNVASNTALAGFPYVSDYTSAKSGMLGLARAAVQEYGLRGIRINTVAPGPVETPMLRRLLDAAPAIETSMTEQALPGRIAHPDEIGYAVRWLLSDEASFVNGACLAVDGGQTTG
jgi:2,5-dichloro-2,5-cyclohexadiene-1,4-diol dehydrogenase 1